jgi:hypothetical protein
LIDKSGYAKPDPIHRAVNGSDQFTNCIDHNVEDR